MREQLLHLAEQGRRKHVGIQVIPASRAANAGHVGAFTIASLDDADAMLMEALEDVTTDKRASIRNGVHGRACRGSSLYQHGNLSCRGAFAPG